jgi:hypothetical protein
VSGVIHGELAALGPVLVADLVDKDLNVLWAHTVRIHERVGNPSDEAALRFEWAWRLLNGDDRHGCDPFGEQPDRVEVAGIPQRYAAVVDMLAA